MSKKAEPEGAVGVIDSEGTFWIKDGEGRWYTDHRGLYEVTYANINDMEVVRGPVTPLFARPPGKGDVTPFEEKAAELAASRLKEIQRLKDLLEKAAALIDAQRKTNEAEQTYVQLHADAMEKRYAYESALKEVES